MNKTNNYFGNGTSVYEKRPHDPLAVSSDNFLLRQTEWLTTQMLFSRQ